MIKTYTLSTFPTVVVPIANIQLANTPEQFKAEYTSVSVIYYTDEKQHWLTQTKILPSFRGNWNCFYRAFYFNIMKYLILHKDELKPFYLKHIKGVNALLTKEFDDLINYINTHLMKLTQISIYLATHPLNLIVNSINLWDKKLQTNWEIRK